MDGYVRAWSSNDAADIGALFTDDALYYPEPYAQPWRGRDEIVREWLERRDEPGDASFEWRPLVETPELSAITGTAVYRDPPRTYSNLWTIRFAPDGRAQEFTEWWMLHPAAGSGDS